MDELDRCRPDFALGLLERIKHLFDVEGVAFVLLVNREQIECYIRAVYGDQVDARAYLLKFGSLFIDLPSRTSADGLVYVKGHQDYCLQLLQHHGFSNLVQDGQHLASYIGTFAGQLHLTLREIEKVFSLLTIYYSALTQNHNLPDMLVALLSVLKVKQPATYSALAAKSLSPEQFRQRSGLDLSQVKGAANFSPEYVAACLDYCLMSEAEFQAATQKEGRPSQLLANFASEMGRNRQKIIPALCRQLDRFSLRPQ